MKLRKKGKCGRSVFRLVLVLFIGYLIACCLLPPLFAEKSTEKALIQPIENDFGRVRVIDENDDALLWRLRMIREAEREIILSTFELRDDTSGQAVMAQLLEAADRGVKVRLLIDGVVGELRLHGSRNFKAFYTHENIEVRFYNPLRITALWKVNYRLHDKYLIVDDTAYLLGGRNTHDIYLGHFSENAQNDRDVVVYEPTSSGGTSLSSLRSYFEAVWDRKDCVPLSCDMSQQERSRIRGELSERLSKLLKQLGRELFPIDWDRETMETNGITLLTGSPEAGNKPPVLWEQLCHLMETAEKSIVIQTPLIVCNDTMLADLRAVCSGVGSVQILTNATENNVNLLASGYFYQKAKVLETGATIIEHCGEQPSHTKTILIDDSISVIGSYNLDVRSTYIDTEIMLVIDSPKINSMLISQVDEQRSEGRSITPDGVVTAGADYLSVELPFLEKCLSTVLGVILYPFQYLL